jgi:hypothetical protein
MYVGPQGFGVCENPLPEQETHNVGVTAGVCVCVLCIHDESRCNIRTLALLIADHCESVTGGRLLPADSTIPK